MNKKRFKLRVSDVKDFITRLRSNIPDPRNRINMFFNDRVAELDLIEKLPLREGIENTNLYNDERGRYKLNFLSNELDNYNFLNDINNVIYIPILNLLIKDYFRFNKFKCNTNISNFK